ncbi:UNVERIFIED_CONTAM: protein PIN-LIKES 1 [Sesamum angustifolium]|uniref:Protein PIN-LIKES 1 n=1 Tax=Sesamum angustifolium TaxID=2727405 RepID=A0AAW2L659_9LAMI
MQKSVILGVVGVKYIALPLTGIAIVKGALRLGLIDDDPLYQFVLLLQFSVPPAANIGMYNNVEVDLSVFSGETVL